MVACVTHTWYSVAAVCGNKGSRTVSGSPLLSRNSAQDRDVNPIACINSCIVVDSVSAKSDPNEEGTAYGQKLIAPKMGRSDWSR